MAGKRSRVGPRRLDFLGSLPLRAVLDGELVALDGEGKPDFPLLCESVLHRLSTARLVFMIFDVLSVNGEHVTSMPYSERRQILDEMRLEGRQWRTPEAFDDGQALWYAICEHDLEGIVAKRSASSYRPGERGWVKVKNREYWRYELEREHAFRSARQPRRRREAVTTT